MSERRRIATCPGCGSDVPARTLAVHVCDWGRWLDHQVDLRRGELERFERELGAYLESPVRPLRALVRRARALHASMTGATTTP